MIITTQEHKYGLTYSGTTGDYVPICYVTSGIDQTGAIISGYAITYNFNTSGIQREKVVQLLEITLEAYNIMV